jgi:hypothetical protein
MLDGISANDIIVGAYSTREGICPMLAAHRAGGRTNLIAFAKAWDRLGFRDARSGRARRATERELLILKAHLEASLLAEDAPVGELAAARSEHLDLVAHRERERAAVSGSKRHRAGPESRQPRGGPRPSDERPGEPLPIPEPGDRPGWSWTRAARRDDECDRLLTRLEEQRAAVEQPSEREPAVTP